MPPQEQADLWMALRDRMKVDWHDLTPQEKKAGRFWSPVLMLKQIHLLSIISGVESRHIEAR